MFTLFWKSLFSLFLTILLIVNIAFVIDMQLFNRNSMVDFSNSYVGISSLINFFQTRTFDSGFLGSFKLFVDNFYVWLTGHFDGSLFSNVDVNSFLGWLELMGNFLSYIILPILYVINAFLYVAYALIVAMYCIGQIVLLWSGSFAFQMPSNPYVVTTPVV